MTERQAVTELALILDALIFMMRPHDRGETDQQFMLLRDRVQEVQRAMILRQKGVSQ